MQAAIDLKSIETLSFSEVCCLCICLWQWLPQWFLLLLVDCFLIMVARFLLLGREALALGALVFCLLGFLRVLCDGFLQGWGKWGVYVCIFFFLRVFSIVRSSYRSFNWIWFSVFFEISWNAIFQVNWEWLQYLSSFHQNAFSCIVNKQRFCWAAHPVSGCFVYLLTFHLKCNVTW